MTTLPLLENWLSPALVRAVGYTLLHSLWQGAVLAGVLAAALPLLRRHRAEVRYGTAAGALACLLLAVGLTFGFYYQNQSASVAPWPTGSPVASSGPALGAVGSPAASSVLAAEAGQPISLTWLQATSRELERYLPLVVIAWLLGLLLMSGRLAGGLVYTRQLRRRGTRALGAEWQQRLAALAQRAGLRQPVALLESARVAGPLVLGHLRPAILLPLGAVAGLSPSLLEALLAHELAHIVRRDYLLNLGLAVAEVLFFYHPAVWFMAGCLRAERENCCDDQAAALCGGDRLRVARALAALAELEQSAEAVPHLALAATGRGGRGSLLARVQRLALGRPQAPTLGEGLLAAMLGVFGLAGLSTGVVLAAPAGRQTVNVFVTTVKKPFNALVGSAQPWAANAAHRGSGVVSAALGVAPPVQGYASSQSRPPRRGSASTVIIEKDKKGRVVNLLVDGQPIETNVPGKKAKRSKPVRTVEVVQVPVPPTRPAPRENHSYSFNFSSDRALEQAQYSLAEALRSPYLSVEERQEMEQELNRLRAEALAAQPGQNRQFKSFRFNLNGFAENNQNTTGHRLRFDVRTRSFKGAAARQADRDAAQADHDAEQADHDVDQPSQPADRAASATRRAELRARMAADAAELRALDGFDSGAPLVLIPAPRAPRAPRAPQAPMLPPPPPPPPVPNTAKLREELHRDGLIKDEKHFFFELNDKGARANGQALTPAQVEKYRQLLDKPASTGKNKSNFSISVDEK